MDNPPQPYVVDVNKLKGVAFENYCDIIDGRRSSWLVVNSEARPWREKIERDEFLAIILSATQESREQCVFPSEHQKRIFGESVPRDSFKAWISIKHLNAMGLEVGRQISFERNGRAEFVAVMNLFEIDKRPGDHLKEGEIRNGFLVHFVNGKKG